MLDWKVDSNNNNNNKDQKNPLAKKSYNNGVFIVAFILYRYRYISLYRTSKRTQQRQIFTRETTVWASTSLQPEIWDSEITDKRLEATLEKINAEIEHVLLILYHYSEYKNESQNWLLGK